MWRFHFNLPEIEIWRSVNTSVLGKITLFIIKSNVGINLKSDILWDLVSISFLLTDGRFYLKIFVKQVRFAEYFYVVSKKLNVAIRINFWC